MTREFLAARAAACLEIAEAAENLATVKQALAVAEIFRGLSRVTDSDDGEFARCVREAEKLYYFCVRISRPGKNGYFVG